MNYQLLLKCNKVHRARWRWFFIWWKAGPSHSHSLSSPIPITRNSWYHHQCKSPVWGIQLLLSQYIALPLQFFKCIWKHALENYNGQVPSHQLIHPESMCQSELNILYQPLSHATYFCQDDGPRHNNQIPSYKDLTVSRHEQALLAGNNDPEDQLVADIFLATLDSTSTLQYYHLIINTIYLLRKEQWGDHAIFRHWNKISQNWWTYIEKK
jgi:hypothetical protein